MHPAKEVRRGSRHSLRDPSHRCSLVITGELISRSCTTSWPDWNHGDLFLTAEALIRVRLPEPTAAAMLLRNSVGPEPQYRELPATANAHSLLAADHTNGYIPLAGVNSARLHRGILRIG